MAKVLLIQPHIDRRIGEQPVKDIAFPINLIHIGTIIEDRHSIKIYDRNLILDDNNLIEYLKDYNPDIIGISSITSEMLFDLIHVGKLIKKEFPKKIIVIGGVHATIEPESILREPYVDYIIRGEGEAAFLEFCDTFDKNPKNLKKLKNVNNNPLRPFVNMDDLKLPNYNLVDIKKYNLFYVNLSRGCPGNCSFCYSSKMWGIKEKPYIRSYSLEKTKELFKELTEKYHVKLFWLVDDNFVPFRARAIQICSFLSNHNLHFFCFVRADYINDEMVRALKMAGCHTIQIGFESGNQRILDFLNKKITVQQNIEAIKCCKRNKIILDARFMIGIPTETEEELNDTLKMIKIYKPDIVNIRIFNPLPGTPLFDYCVKKGFFKKPKTLEEWAAWTGDMTYVKHNTSNISDKILMKQIKHNKIMFFYKSIYLKIKSVFFFIPKTADRILGKIGIFLKKHNPDLYFKLKGIKNEENKKSA